MLAGDDLGDVLGGWVVEHPDAAVRSLSAWLLGLSGHRRQAGVLWRAWRQDPDPGVRSSGLFALARLGEIEAVRVLLGEADRAEPCPERSHARIHAFSLLQLREALPES